MTNENDHIRVLYNISIIIIAKCCVCVCLSVCLCVCGLCNSKYFLLEQDRDIIIFLWCRYNVGACRANSEKILISHVTTWSRDQDLKCGLNENRSNYELLQPHIWKVIILSIYPDAQNLFVALLSCDSHVTKNKKLNILRTIVATHYCSTSYER